MTHQDSQAAHAQHAPSDQDEATPVPVEQDAARAQGAEPAHARASGASDQGSERLDRLEGLLEGLAHDFARDRMERARLRNAPPSETSSAESSAFSQFLAAHRQRARADSLSEAMGIAPPFQRGVQQPPYAPAQQQVQFQRAQQQVSPQPPQQQEPHVSPQLPAYQQQFAPPQNFGLRVPTLKDMKLPLERFSGKEEYEGLGAGFKDWGLRFLDELVAAQVISGGDWPEEFKVRVLNRYLEGAARKHFERMKTIWVLESPTLEHLMNRMLEVYEKEITVEQATRLMKARKRSDRSWTEQYQYLVAVATAADCSDRFVLQYICECASPETRRAMQTRIDRRRADHLRQAWELADFASTFEPDGYSGFGKNSNNRGSHATGRGGNMVANAVVKENEKKCWNCKQSGHIKKNCPGLSSSGQAMFALAVGDGCCTTWVLDSGARRHLVKDINMLVDVVDCREECKVADGQTLSVTKKGSVVLRATVDGKEHDVVISNVFYAERLAQNLLSYCKLEEKGMVLVYKKNCRYLARASDGARVFEVRKENDVLVVSAHSAASTTKTVNTSTREQNSSAVFTALEQAESDNALSAVKCTLMELHGRLGHVMLDTVEKMADTPGSGIELTDRTRVNCLTCAKGKQAKNPQSKKDSGKHSPIDRIGGVICSDLKGPMTPADRNGNRYMVNFVDHHTNYCRVFVARKKDLAAKMFENFLVHFEREFDCKVHVLRTDGGGEYRNVDLFCQSTGVVRQVSEAKNQASNGKAERMHRTVLNMARCMIFDSGLALHFWGDAVQYAAYVLNRTPTSANPNRVSPLEMLTGVKPQLSDIVVFGSACTAYRDPGTKAWKPRAQAGMIVGKDDETKGYKVYLPHERVVIVTQHVQNVETLNAAGNEQLQAQLRREDPELDQAVREREEVAQRKEQQGGKSKRTRRGKRAGKKSKRSAKVDKQVADDNDRAVEPLQPPAQPEPSRMRTRNMGQKHVPVAMASITEDPRNYREAMRSSRAHDWRQAMADEIAALEANGTWELVAKAPKDKLLHSKWVFKTKKHADGTLERYKARLVACGNEQEYGVDYTDTFSAALEMLSCRILLALSRKMRVPARHGDVPNAYVKAEKEPDMEILLHLPQGMHVTPAALSGLGVTDQKHVALRLIKSLYGLKQAGRLWAQHLRATLLKLGFRQCYTDSCIYVRGSGADLTLVGVYVDDLLVTGASEANVERFFSDMSVLDVKNLGTVSKFLGMAISYDDEHGYLLEQRQTIEELLQRFGLAEANPVRVPVSDDQDGENDGELLPNSGEGTPASPTVRLFQSLVGSLLWIARCTRPDIAFAVHRVTRRSHAPHEADWRRAKRIARYLKGTINLKLCLEGAMASTIETGVKIEGYSDADYAADREDRKSVSGGMLWMDGMIVGWFCKKQTSVALSTMEAEFVAGSLVASELLGLRELLEELGVAVQQSMVLHVDNQAAIKQMEGEDSSGKAKHIDVRVKFVKDYVNKGVIAVMYCESRMMRADLLTKAFPAPRLEELRGLAFLK